MSCTGSLHNLPSAWSVVSLQNGQISWWQNARGRSAGDSVSRHKWSTHWWPFEQSALEEICQVMNQPGAPQSDWLELMLEIWPCGRKQQSITCWSCLLLCLVQCALKFLSSGHSPAINSTASDVCTYRGSLAYFSYQQSKRYTLLSRPQPAYNIISKQNWHVNVDVHETHFELLTEAFADNKAALSSSFSFCSAEISVSISFIWD